MSEKKEDAKTDEKKMFMEKYASDFAATYTVLKANMPKDTPPEILAVAVKDLKAALYYWEKEQARAASQNSRPAPTAGEKSTDRMTEGMLDGLVWKDSKNGGQWTFRTNRDGSMVEDLKPLQGLLEHIKAERRLVIGKYEYGVSGENDKFLTRYPV